MPAKKTKKKSQKQPPPRPEDDLINLLIAKSNDLQLVEAGAASRTKWDPVDKVYKSYFLTAVSDADLDQFVEGTYELCQRTAFGNDEAARKARIKQIFSEEVKRNSKWFKAGLLGQVPKGTYEDTGGKFSVGVVEYTANADDVKFGNGGTTYRVLTSAALDKKYYKSFDSMTKQDILKVYTKLEITKIKTADGKVDLTKLNKTQLDRKIYGTTVPFLKRPIAKKVAVAIETFQNEMKWYHNDVTGSNVFVNVHSSDKKLDIRLIDIAPFSSKTRFGSEYKPSVDDFVDGTGSAFFLQKVVLGGVFPENMRALYKKYKLVPATSDEIPADITSVDAACELSRIATYQKDLFTDGDLASLDSVLQVMLKTYNRQLEYFKQETWNEPPLVRSPTSDAGANSDGASSSASESEGDEQEPAKVPSDDENVSEMSSPSVPDGPTYNGINKSDSEPINPNAEEPEEVVATEEADEAEELEKEEETKVDKKRVVSGKKQAHVLQKGLHRSKLLQNKSHLPLKNSETERGKKFNPNRAVDTMTESIAKAVKLSTNTIMEKYPGMMSKIMFLNRNWKNGTRPAKDGIWKAVEALSSMYDKTFVSCEPPEKEFSAEEQNFIVAVYTLIAHSSNYRAQEYVWKTDVEVTDIIFECA